MRKETKKLLKYEYDENNKFIIVLDTKINKLVNDMKELIKRNNFITEQLNKK